MTNESADAGEDPQRLLTRTRDLARQVRRTQRATWFPLLVFAAVTFASIPTYLLGHSLGTCVALGPGRVCTAYPTAAIVYWPIALVLAYVAIAAFYIRQSQARGVGTRIRPYVIAGIILALAMTAATVWALYHPPADDVLRWLPDSPFRLSSPAVAIGLALLLLAWAERNWALLALACGYLVVVLVRVSFGWVIHHPEWTFLPQTVIDGGILLLGGIGFLRAQRSGQRSAE